MLLNKSISPLFMSVDNTDIVWSDPRTYFALIGTSIGVAGFLFGLLSHRWSRRESRLESLGKILQPLVKAGQCLMRANVKRRTCEHIKHSYPDPEKTPDALHRFNELVVQYNEEMRESEKELRNAEAEYASRSFRFPDSISRAVNAAQTTLSEMGRLVNRGLFDKADILLAQFRDEYSAITNTARGWRLADPFEGIRKYFSRSKKKDSINQEQYELSAKEMDGVLELLHKRVTTEARNSFVVHPPKIVIDDPAILNDDTVIEKLKDKIFSVVFQDGTVTMLTLPELMAYVYNMIVYAMQKAELEAMVAAANPEGEREFKVTFRFSMSQIMQPEMVKALLDKISFADTPSDG